MFQKIIFQINIVLLNLIFIKLYWKNIIDNIKILIDWLIVFQITAALVSIRDIKINNNNNNKNLTDLKLLNDCVWTL